MGWARTSPVVEKERERKNNTRRSHDALYPPSSPPLAGRRDSGGATYSPPPPSPRSRGGPDVVVRRRRRPIGRWKKGAARFFSPEKRGDRSPHIIYHVSDGVRGGTGPDGTGRSMMPQYPAEFPPDDDATRGRRGRPLPAGIYNITAYPVRIVRRIRVDEWGSMPPISIPPTSSILLVGMPPPSSSSSALRSLRVPSSERPPIQF